MKYYIIGKVKNFNTIKTFIKEYTSKQEAEKIFNGLIANNGQARLPLKLYEGNTIIKAV